MELFAHEKPPPAARRGPHQVLPKTVGTITAQKDVIVYVAKVDRAGSNRRDLSELTEIGKIRCGWIDSDAGAALYRECFRSVGSSDYDVIKLIEDDFLPGTQGDEVVLT